MPRKKRALLMTVGTGTGDKRCSLAHGLMCSIDSKDPDFICFFVSKDSKPTVDALKKVFNNKFDEYLVQVEHDFKGLRSQVPQVISSDFLKLVNGGAFHDGEKVVEELMQIVQVRK